MKSLQKNFSGEEIPAIYRVHEDPDRSKISALNESLVKFGYSIKSG